MQNGIRRALRGLAVGVAILIVGAGSATAWDGAGHRMITRVALRGLDESMPAWLKDDASVLAIADQSQTPDRWRGVSAQRVPQLKHLNDPDHYLDVEDLEAMGMSLRTMPILRHEYVRAVAAARAKPEFAGEPVDPKKDMAKTNEYPGFLPISTLEAYGKVVSAFKMVRQFEGLNQSGREPQIEAAKWNARIHIGLLSHFVGDTAQPLHTTKHHHGWVGENPNGYTTDYGFHRYIDGEILRIHRIADSDIAPKSDFARAIAADDLWEQTAQHIERSFKEVEPLYKLKKSGDLEQAVGKAFVVERLADASSQLSAMIEAAWAEAAPTPKELQDLKGFEGDRPPTPTGDAAAAVGGTQPPAPTGAK